MAQKINSQAERAPAVALPPRNSSSKAVIAGRGRASLIQRAAVATGFPPEALLDVGVQDDRLVIVTIDGRKHHLASLPDTAVSVQTPQGEQP